MIHWLRVRVETGSEFAHFTVGVGRAQSLAFATRAYLTRNSRSTAAALSTSPTRRNPSAHAAMFRASCSPIGLLWSCSGRVPPPPGRSASVRDVPRGSTARRLSASGASDCGTSCPSGPFEIRCTERYQGFESPSLRKVSLRNLPNPDRWTSHLLRFGTGRAVLFALGAARARFLALNSTMLARSTSQRGDAFARPLEEPWSHDAGALISGSLHAILEVRMVWAD